MPLRFYSPSSSESESTDGLLSDNAPPAPAAPPAPCLYASSRQPRPSPSPPDTDAGRPRQTLRRRLTSAVAFGRGGSSAKSASAPSAIDVEPPAPPSRMRRSETSRAGRAPCRSRCRRLRPLAVEEVRVLVVDEAGLGERADPDALLGPRVVLLRLHLDQAAAQLPLVAHRYLVALRPRRVDHPPVGAEHAVAAPSTRTFRFSLAST